MRRVSFSSHGVLTFFVVLLTYSLATASVAASSTKLRLDGNAKGIPSFTLTPDQISEHCAEIRKDTKKSLDEIAKDKGSATFASTVAATETALSEFAFHMQYLTFPAYVSPDKLTRDAGRKCEDELNKDSVGFFARMDLYKRFKAFGETSKAKELSGQDKRLLEDYMRSFKSNGLHLKSKSVRKKIKKLNEKLIKLATDFDQNIRDYQDPFLVTKEELEGMSEDYINRLKKDESGKYILTLAYPDFFPFIRNAKNADARRRYYVKFRNTAHDTNIKVLNEMLKLRLKRAKLLGFKTHADAVFGLSNRMAKSPEQVRTFLRDLRTKLGPRLAMDYNEMKRLKCEELESCSGNDWKKQTIQLWDSFYYANMIKKKKYSVDSQKIQEYFPLDTVNQGMFDIYQGLLGVTFHEVKDADVWDKHVQLFEVRDKKTSETMGYFFLDLFPREGKFQHAAAFGIRFRYELPGGTNQTSIASMVANFTPPTKDRPALLTHGEVETYFHEFGHIMHEVLGTAKYQSQAGIAVPRDFVEAPSQMLENWVWKLESLRKLSGHYKTGNRLPASLLKKMIEAKDVARGARYSRQILYGLIDLAYHMSEKEVDTTEVWKKLETKVAGVPFIEGTQPQAGFGHLTGYDAGYYSYLWAKVFAADMFSLFEKQGIFNKKLGMKYRKWILEPAGSEDPNILLEQFLGREPNNAAFLKNLGL